MYSTNNVNFDYSYQNLSNTVIEQRFSMNFRRIERPLMSWKEEVIDTAKNIKNMAESKPLILCLSGGTDCEIMATAFLENNIDFSVVSCRHEIGTNEHDIVFARDFCKRKGIEHIIFDINHIEFFTDGINQYIEQGYRSNRIFRYFQLLLLEKVESLGGCAVLGGGDPMYFRINDNIVLKYAPDFNLCLDWCKNHNSLHFPYFYKQNPHIFASYMKQELIEFLLSRPEYFKDEWFVSLEKSLMYTAIWPDIQRRPKYHGFENMRYLKITKEKRLFEKFPDIEHLILPISLIKKQLGII